jgi:hypothetical protein
MRRRKLDLRLVLCIAALSCSDDPATGAEVATYRRLRGQLVRAETTSTPDRGRYAADRVRLHSSSGLVATGRMLRPRVRGRCLPAVLLQNGREENSDVIGRLPAEFGDVAVLSLDYPEEFPYTLKARDLLNSARLERPAREVPALFLLAARYLASRSDIDTSRIVLAATSFAVPFATIAAAADPIFTNVALIYGAGDLAGVLAANLDAPGLLRRPLASLAMQPFAAFAPERFIALIAPSPIIMINGVDDPQMPARAAQRLYDAARQPKELIWLRTGHLMPTDSALIRTLVDTALARLPVLHGVGTPARCRR